LPNTHSSLDRRQNHDLHESLFLRILYFLNRTSKHPYSAVIETDFAFVLTTTFWGALGCNFAFCILTKCYEETSVFICLFNIETERTHQVFTIDFVFNPLNCNFCTVCK